MPSAQTTTAYPGGDTGRGLDVTVVVPTRNERDGVEELVERVAGALGAAPFDYELLFVDDSDDGTVDLLAALAVRGAPLRVLHRPPGARSGGLGTALVAGFDAALGRVIAVCDADLQHPPEAIRGLVEPILFDAVDVAVGTRYAHGGRAEGLASPTRRLASRASGTLSRAVVPATRGFSDAGGGFWAARRELLVASRLEPTGFKSLLEVLARTPWNRAVEVPYTFAGRRQGTSNFGWREVVRFGRHLGRLTLRPTPDGAPPSAAPVSPGVLSAAMPAPAVLSPRALSPAALSPAALSPAVSAPAVSAPAVSAPAVSAPAAPAARLVSPTARAGPGRRLPGPASRLIVALVAIFAAFLTFEAFAILAHPNGPFLDEGIYISAGLRTLHGFGMSDGYAGWFAGSLLWPTFAGASYALGGLEATRLAAAVLVTVACLGSVSLTRRLFGGRAAVLGAVLLLGAAPTLSLAHLGVVDVVAAAGLGVTLGAIGELAHSGHRIWLVLAALAYAAGTLGKYPMAFTLPWIGYLLVWALPRDRRRDVVIFAAVYGAVLLAWFLPLRAQLAYFLHWRVSNNPAFGVTAAMVAFEQALFGLPWALAAAAGIVLARRRHGALPVVLASALALFPLYHLVTVNSTGASKHDVYGFLVACPVAGLGLSEATRRRPGKALLIPLLAALSVFDASHSTVMDRAWPDESGVGSYLAGHLRQGQTLLAPDGWQVLPPIEDHGISSPQVQMTDSYGFAHAARPLDVCRFDWVVVDRNYNPWPASVPAALARCGYRPVYRQSSRITDLGRTLRYVTWTATFTVWEKP